MGRNGQKKNKYHANKELILRNKKYVLDYLRKHPCVDCGEPDPVVLEFDHVSGKKKATISYMIRNTYSLAAIKKEIRKCEVRCSNCHKRRTAKVQGWYKGLM